MFMKIICNGEELEVVTDATLLALIRKMELNPDTVVAECDGTVIPREEYDEFVLPAGARLELVRFVGGG
jgi:sulfur carrier protein